MNDLDRQPAQHPSFYPLNEMATLLAFRVQKPGEDLRSTVDKVRKRMRYAVEKDELHVMGPSPQIQLFFAAQVFAWARKKWPERFCDVSVRHDETVSDGLKIAVSVRDWHYPADVDECHRLLRAAYEDVELLGEELAAANREIEKLRPLAERYEENRERNRQSAKRPRKNV